MFNQITVSSVSAANSAIAADTTSFRLHQLLHFRLSMVGILCFKFSPNPLMFSLTRETDTKKVEPNAEQIINIAIWQLAISQNWCFGQFHLRRIEVFQLPLLLTLHPSLLIDVRLKGHLHRYKLHQIF
jgi:hypothetical protein